MMANESSQFCVSSNQSEDDSSENQAESRVVYARGELILRWGDARKRLLYHSAGLFLSTCYRVPISIIGCKT